MDADAVYAQALETYKVGDMSASRAGLEQARAAFLAQGEESKAASAANDLAVVYSLTGRRDQARELLVETQQAFERMGNIAGQARATGNLAQLLSKSGDANAAQSSYIHAADLFSRAGDRKSEYHTYRALSQMELRRGRWLEALGAYDLALGAKGGSGLLRWFLQIPLRLTGIRK